MLRSLVLFFALAPAVAVAQPVEIAVESGGVSLPATLTLAADRDAPRPLTIYLHGNPGRPLDQPSDIADALVASGVDVVRFTYRGLWGTGGDFTLTNSVADLDAVLDVVTAPAFAARLGHVPSSVVLVGYSYGTAAALVGADERVDGIVALAPCDHGYFGGEFADPDSEIRDFLDRVTASLFGEGGPVEGGGPAFIDDLVSNAEAYGFPAQAERLLGTRLLLLGGMDDAVCAVEDHVVPIARRLRALEHPDFDARVLPMDHGFDGVGREAVLEIATDWIATSFPTGADDRPDGVDRPNVEHLTGAGVLPFDPPLPFSDAVRVGDTVLLSGMIGLRPGTMELVPGGIEAEARQTMENIAATLDAHGLALADVVKCTVMMEDIAEWGAFNAVYATFFQAPYPARSAFGADGLALDARVEVECIAAVPPTPRTSGR